MSASNDGAAKVVSPQRLKNFEDDDTAGDFELAPPPRPRRPPPTSTLEESKPAKQAEKATRKSPRKAAAAPTAATVPTVAAVPERPQEASPRTVDAPEGPAPVTKGIEQRVRRSNVHIPVSLLGPINDKTSAEGLSNGEIIIAAIEQTFDQLPDLIHPAPTTGGHLFASRRSRASRSTDGPLTPLNYGLREVDYQTLDHLVEELRASSRGHLITAALTAYFDTP